MVPEGTTKDQIQLAELRMEHALKSSSAWDVVSSKKSISSSSSGKVWSKGTSGGCISCGDDGDDSCDECCCNKEAEEGGIEEDYDEATDEDSIE